MAMELVLPYIAKYSSIFDLSSTCRIELLFVRLIRNSDQPPKGKSGLFSVLFESNIHAPSIFIFSANKV
jgi:hypothetical protein